MYSTAKAVHPDEVQPATGDANTSLLASLPSLSCASLVCQRFGSATESDRSELQCTVRTAEMIIGTPFPTSKNVTPPE